MFIKIVNKFEFLIKARGHSTIEKMKPSDYPSQQPVSMSAISSATNLQSILHKHQSSGRNFFDHSNLASNNSVSGGSLRASKAQKHQQSQQVLSGGATLAKNAHVSSSLRKRTQKLNNFFDSGSLTRKSNKANLITQALPQTASR